MVEAGRKPLVLCLRRLEKLGLLDRGNNLAAPPGPRVIKRGGEKGFHSGGFKCAGQSFRFF
jgi:hypothetical protein